MRHGPEMEIERLLERSHLASETITNEECAVMHGSGTSDFEVRATTHAHECTCRRRLEGEIEDLSGTRGGRTLIPRVKSPVLGRLS